MTQNNWYSDSTVQVSKGGTGTASIIDHTILVGSGTDPVTEIGPLTNGQLVIGSTGADPVAATITQGTGITVTNGAGSITIAASGSTGTVVQIVSTSTSAAFNITTVIPTDDTIPQNTEGDEILTLAITPTSATNKLRIQFNISGGGSTTNVDVKMALFQDSTAGALAAILLSRSANTESYSNGTIDYHMVAGTTSSTTFKIRGGPNSGTARFNTQATGSATRIFGGVANASFTITEYSV